jgi:hypothetical protein
MADYAKLVTIYQPAACCEKEPRTPLMSDKLPEPWGEYALQAGVPVKLALGDLRLQVQAMSNELMTAARHERALRPGATDVSSAAPTWGRFALSEPCRRIALHPALPLRPMIVHPEQSFTLLQRAEARIYVRLPLWAGIEAVGAQRVPVVEYPAFLLSSAWFGMMDEGELCYWIDTSARRMVPSDLCRPQHALCPIQLINDSNEKLLVQKLTVRASGLGIYCHDEQLWTDEIRIVFHGTHMKSSIAFAGEAPEEARNARLVTRPRVANRGSFFARTFALPAWSTRGILTR